jgi:hypothetical protein
VQAIYSEVYTFHTTAKGGVLLKINGQALCDALNDSEVSSSNTIALQSGQQYELEFTYKKSGVRAQAMLEWESSSQVRQRIPRYQLFSRPAQNTGLVTAYEAENYDGYSAALKFGDYDANTLLNKAGFAVQTIKSLKVAEGIKVTLFSENNCTGDSLVVESDQANLDNRVVSLRVTNAGINLPNGTYFIKPQTGAYMMAIEGNYQESGNGKKAQLSRNTGNINMQFRFTRQHNGTYRIEPVSSGKSLEISNFSKDNYALVQQWKTSDTENQQFIVLPTAENGFYKIISSFSEKMIKPVSSMSSALICQVDMQNQPNVLWQLEPVPPLSDGTGNGLSAEYYNGLNFNTLRAEQIDATINFNWGTAKPHPNVNADNVSIRWQGTIEPRSTEEYTFYVNSDNGRRLWIDNQLIIDKWIDDYDIEYSGTANLQAGQSYNIKLEYFESTGGAYCRLEWISPKQPREIVPQSQLYSMDRTGLQDHKTNEAVTIYPNPAKNEIWITNSETEHYDRIQIIDISGKIWVNDSLVSGQPVDISAIPAGIYFVRLKTNDNTLVNKLIIK